MISNSKKAVIHIAKAQTGMTEDEYRALLSSVGVASSKDLIPLKFDIVMKRFGKMGFKRKKSKKRGAPATSKTRLLGKITAMCIDMGLKQGYVNAIARKMFGVDLVAWCDADQLRKIVAALMYYKKRQGAKAQRDKGTKGQSKRETAGGSYENDGVYNK